MPTALRMMTEASNMPHVLEDVGECVELGGGDILYALQLVGRVYLACLSWDTKRVCVYSVERWEPDNLCDWIEGTPLLSLGYCIGDVIARVAGQAIAGSGLPVKTTHQAGERQDPITIPRDAGDAQRHRPRRSVSAFPRLCTLRVRAADRLPASSRICPSNGRFLNSLLDWRFALASKHPIC
jgi:hypothetical protein